MNSENKLERILEEVNQIRQAMDENQIIVGFFEKKKESVWREMRLKQKFFCIDCQAEVSLRLGKKRKWHFAHKKKSMCKGNHEGETTMHRVGKTDIYQLFKQDYIVELEPYLPKTKQRPDMLIKGDLQIAVEYQCATIEAETLYKRNWLYHSSGIKPIWILGANRIKRTDSYIFKLHGFEWFALQTYKKEAFLIYYDTERKSFGMLRHITALQSNLVLAHLIEFPLRDTSFTSLLKPKSLKVSFFHAFKQHRKKTAINILLSNRKFLLFLYQKKRKELPILAGWPLLAQKYIQLSPFIWQSFFLIDFLQHIPLKQSFSINVCESGLLAIFSKHVNALRPFCAQQKVIRQAVKQYVDLLCAFQILTHQEDQLYQRVRSIDFQALSEDEMIKIWHTAILF